MDGSGGAVAAGAAAAATAAAIANAIKASGAIVRVEPQAFSTIIDRMEAPLVVMADKTFFSGTYKYLTSYKGLAFFTKSDKRLDLPGGAELICAGKIWIPG